MEGPLTLEHLTLEPLESPDPPEYQGPTAPTNIRGISTTSSQSYNPRRTPPFRLDPDEHFLKFSHSSQS